MCTGVIVVGLVAMFCTDRDNPLLLLLSKLVAEEVLLNADGPAFAALPKALKIMPPPFCAKYRRLLRQL
jgi:hypothetical protein